MLCRKGGSWRDGVSLSLSYGMTPDQNSTKMTMDKMIITFFSLVTVVFILAILAVYCYVRRQQSQRQIR